MRILSLAFIALTFCSFGTARAQSFDDTPLASCPGYGAHPIVSDLNWSVNCFLQALYDKNIAIAVALATLARCLPSDPDACIGGVIDEPARNFFFGGSNPGRSLHDLVAGTNSVVVTYEPADSGVVVTFLVKPEKSKVNVVQGFMVDYFACDFAFDDAKQIWLLDGICRLDVVDVDESLVVDMSGAASDLPAMLWRPKK